jgi:4-hydroxybenzoate polyprenyltransferase
VNNRWWIYQKERFPLVAHGPLIVVFCMAVMSFSALQSQQGLSLDLVRVAGAVASTLVLFFQLRVADEYKDIDIDSRFRPERPVPRGLVKLDELAKLAFAGAALQFAIAMYIDIGLVPILLAVWLYMGIMTKEFFAATWLRKHPVAYLLSHMLIMPLMAFYVSAFDWLCDCRVMPRGMVWMLLVSFFCGLVLELGRKIRVPRHEREGVETYSGIWGTGVAVVIWFASIAAAVAAYAHAAALIVPAGLYLTLGAAVLGLGVLTMALFPAPADHGYREFGEKCIAPNSGLAVVILYFGLGPLQALGVLFQTVAA